MIRIDAHELARGIKDYLVRSTLALMLLSDVSGSTPHT